MPALYLHIPFCKTRCIYCDFYSETSLQLQNRYVAALCREMAMRRHYLSDNHLASVYFGGGTPSLLKENHFVQIFDAIRSCFLLSPDTEITVECNPDDISKPLILSLKHLGVNRISIGVQSFHDTELQFLHRRHSARQAVDAVKLCQQCGIANISIDLIYGLPHQTPDVWAATLQQAVTLNVPHISAYSLTYENTTPLTRLLQQGKIQQLEEDIALQLFELLLDTMHRNGFIQYEISNFCQPGFHSRHNTAYWTNASYLGLGAAAHSFDGVSRQWNCADVKRYCDATECEDLVVEREILSVRERYNEFVFTALRRTEGIALDELECYFGKEYTDYCLTNSDIYRRCHWLEIADNHLRLTQRGIFVSDRIMSELMML
ncbi:MAG: radical SAM family heme chaperone HemW [Prevotellaceae bacterium]|jgi:oxygen-independent coproporphyrinogen-3 oxidase|nr:radical SAM family heme chaperone HemW [Prevotellaceae bacterium]